jgi:hypothetical protein
VSALVVARAARAGTTALDVRSTAPAGLGVLARALTLLALLAFVTPGEAALPSPPFTLDVTPSRIDAGDSVVVRITPTGGAGSFDLYLMWALAPEAAFLGPDGAWAPRPTAFRAGVAAGGAPISARWTANPPGEIPLALVVVPAGGDPMDRFAWAFQPVLAPLSVRVAAAPVPVPWRVLAPLAIGTLVACTFVLRGGRPFLG